MSKFNSLAIGVLTAIAIVPASQAMAATSNSSAAIQQPAGDLHAQVILKIGTQDRDRDYNSSGNWDRRRWLEWQREREARARWRSEYRRDRYGSYERHDSYRNYRYGR